MVNFADVRIELGTKNHLEVCRFIMDNDKNGVFKSALIYPANFIQHFKILAAANQIIIFRGVMGICAVCSFMLVNENNVHEVNKVTWKMPENISSGDILYIDACLIKDGVNTLTVKNVFDTFIDIRPRIKEVRWFNVPANRFYRKTIRRVKKCQTVGS